MTTQSIEAAGGLYNIELKQERRARCPLGIGAMLTRVAAYIRAARERHCAIAALRGFSGQQLADVGITRDEIETVVRTGRSRRMMQGL